MKNYFTLLFILVIAFAKGQITRQWVATYNGQGDFNDRYTCMTTDGSGNIYLGGSTTNPDICRDYLVVKLNSSGAVQWRKEFDWTGNGPDEALAIAVDANAVYVTGFAFSSNDVRSSTDYLTVKMNLNGDTVWTRTYNHSVADAYDQANSIFVDGNGNVYVTGQSDNDSTANTNDDYATVKYSSNGTEQWVRRFNGFGDGTDQAVKVVADNSGNVYVTGRSSNGNDDDYVTIQYNSSGTQQWIKYDDRGGRDRATDMVIDANANVYITGRSDNGSTDDFWTLKYNSAGVSQWANGVAFDFVDDDRATAIAVDANGNVYVTGQSDADASGLRNWNYETVKYNSSGTQTWAKSYDGAVGQDDIASSVAVDGSGNVFVTGQSDGDATAAIVNNIATVGYNSSGTQILAPVYAGAGGQDDAGVAVISTANGCVVAGYIEDASNMKNALAVSYSTSGTKLWEQEFNGTGDNNENIRGLAVDANNNVFVAGYSVERNADRNMSLVKFDASGNFVCEHNFDGDATGSHDDGQAVILDSNGNPFIAGSIHNKGESFNIAYARFNPATCDSVWKRNYDAPAHGSDRTYDMVGDAAGNMYITGRVDGDPSLLSNENCFTAKIDANGTIVWSQSYNSSGSNDDRGLFVRVASSGNVYVAGRTFNGIDFDILLLKYNSGGTQQWIQTYTGGNGNDQPTDLKIDASENVYICGRAEEVTDSVYDYVTLKYDVNGVQQWAKKYNGTGSGNDEAEALAVDGNGNVVVTGFSDADATANENLDIVTVKYDGSGNQGWVKNFNGSANADDIADDIVVNASNQIYLTGHTNKVSSLNTNYDIITFVLDTGGNQLWSDVFNGTSDSSDIPNLLTLNGNDFYVAGSSVKTSEMRNMLVIKYSGTVTAVGEISKEEISVLPNPFNNSLQVKIDNETADFYLLSEIGQKVFHQKVKQGNNSILLPTISRGIYFYHIKNETGLMHTGKLVHSE